MTDGIGRTIDYLRVSVTDKCNLRCQYCMPKEGVKRLPHDSLLSLEELYRVIAVMAELGVKKVRFTGGEPLVRKNLVKLIADVRKISGIEEIALTTNGILLGEKACALKEAGVDRVNVSLDTCDEKTFERITGYDGYKQVREGILAARAAGMGVKINCVPCSVSSKSARLVRRARPAAATHTRFKRVCVLDSRRFFTFSAKISPHLSQKGRFSLDIVSHFLQMFIYFNPKHFIASNIF